MCKFWERLEAKTRLGHGLIKEIFKDFESLILKKAPSKKITKKGYIRPIKQESKRKKVE